MIVVDTSALVAILFDEPEKQAFENGIASGECCVMSAVSVHETALVLRVKRGAAAASDFGNFSRCLEPIRLRGLRFGQDHERALAVKRARASQGARAAHAPTAEAYPAAEESIAAAGRRGTLKELVKGYKVGRATISRLAK